MTTFFAQQKVKMDSTEPESTTYDVIFSSPHESGPQKTEKASNYFELICPSESISDAPVGKLPLSKSKMKNRHIVGQLRDIYLKPNPQK